jgi:hypothetical protein
MEIEEKILFSTAVRYFYKKMVRRAKKGCIYIFF